MPVTGYCPAESGAKNGGRLTPWHIDYRGGKRQRAGVVQDAGAFVGAAENVQGSIFYDLAFGKRRNHIAIRREVNRTLHDLFREVQTGVDGRGSLAKFIAGAGGPGRLSLPGGEAVIPILTAAGAGLDPQRLAEIEPQNGGSHVFQHGGVGGFMVGGTAGEYEETDRHEN